MPSTIRRLITDTDVETELLPAHERTKIVNSLGHAFEPIGENIQKAIDELPNVTPQGAWWPPPPWPTGKCGTIWLPNKILHIKKRLIIPLGSVISIIGAGNSGLLPQPQIGSTYFGGTVIYSHDPLGIIDVPWLELGKPVTYFWMRDLELRQENPSEPVDSVALNLDGMIEGAVENVSIVSDASAAETPNLRTALSVTGGDASNFLSFRQIRIQSFREWGVVADTSHLSMMDIHVRRITGADWPKAYYIHPAKQNVWINIHSFDVKIGISLYGDTLQRFTVYNPHFETVEKCFENNTTDGETSVVISPFLDGDITWGVNEGDLSNRSKCIVKYLTYFPDRTKKSENAGIATFNGGGTTFTIPHSLVQAPSVYRVNPASVDARGDFHISVDDTNITVEYASATPTGTDNIVLNWYAEI